MIICDSGKLSWRGWAAGEGGRVAAIEGGTQRFRLSSVHILGGRVQGFHRIMNADSTGTWTRFQRDREQISPLGGIVMTMPFRHRWW
jgi:hypothetical protein